MRPLHVLCFFRIICSHQSFGLLGGAVAGSFSCDGCFCDDGDREGSANATSTWQSPVYGMAFFLSPKLAVSLSPVVGDHFFAGKAHRLLPARQTSRLSLYECTVDCFVDSLMFVSAL